MSAVPSIPHPRTLSSLAPLPPPTASFPRREKRREEEEREREREREAEPPRTSRDHVSGAHARQDHPAAPIAKARAARHPAEASGASCANRPKHPTPASADNRLQSSRPARRLERVKRFELSTFTLAKLSGNPTQDLERAVVRHVSRFRAIGKAWTRVDVSGCESTPVARSACTCIQRSTARRVRFAGRHIRPEGESDARSPLAGGSDSTTFTRSHARDARPLSDRGEGARRPRSIRGAGRRP